MLGCTSAAIIWAQKLSDGYCQSTELVLDDFLGAAHYEQVHANQLISQALSPQLHFSSQFLGYSFPETSRLDPSGQYK